MREFDIVICGAGLVGLLMANLLKGSPYKIAVVDAGKEPKALNASSQIATSVSEAVNSEFDSGFAPRVSALNAKSIELLERCQVLPLLSRFASFSRMEIKDGEGAGEISFDAQEMQIGERLGIVIENHLVLDAMLQSLRAEPSITLLYNHKLDDIDAARNDSENTTVLEFLDEAPIRCQLLVAADGANSKVRELQGQKVVGWQYDQTAIVTTIRTSRAHQNIPRQWFTAAGPLAFLPLAEPHLCSIVWSHTDAQEMLGLSAEDFCRELNIASEFELGDVLATDARFSFPLRQQHALVYARPGVILVGDAAHAIHPLAGQGANLGFADAAVLASELRQCAFSDLGLSDPELRTRFTRMRQPQNLLVASAMEAIKHLYGNQNPVLGFARNHLMRFANANAPLKSMLMKVAGGMS